ncbi:Phenylacetic acid catabolic protein [Amycolatopsis benzoatilytica]|uniref:Phenylacetic acid catabolic protein n=1 Tax=Amycolatopsis benzoatilytica TaxID=346045 RepID=UPI00146D909C|nr:Phenylacetic acid catabolic protein [Amycolatopsis benzoatilytica]
MSVQDSQSAKPVQRQRYELHDDVPDVVRNGARRFAAIQALNEMIGSMIYVPWITRAPSYARKQMMIAKVQDEIGHGHMSARVAADLGKPWEEILVDYLEGRAFLHNIFHYEFESWEEFGAGGLLMNSAAIVQFRSLLQGVYLPYARALKRVAREESFHFQHSIDITWEVMEYGNDRQRSRIQAAFETWLPRVLAFLGPPDAETIHENAMWKAGLKPHSNDEVRQQWLNKTIPVFRKLGIHTDPDLVCETSAGQWTYAQPDWAETKRIIRNEGPSSTARLEHARTVLERNADYRRTCKAAA